MTLLAQLLIGFSVFCALALALTQFGNARHGMPGVSRCMGLALLLSLAGLQGAHFAWLALGRDWVAAWPYRLLLFAVAPAFYGFAQPLLRPAAGPARRQALHAVPVALAPLLDAAWALPLAFGVGAGYLLWLGRSLWALRRERARFRLEMFLLGAVFAIAIGVAALGLARSALPGPLFFELYAVAIGLAFFLVQTALGLRPQLSEAVQETAQAAYAQSTLTRVDCDAALARLQALMQDGRAYTDPELSLPGLAARLDLSAHQLSELMNARLGKGFSRHLREQRVAAARALLRAEPSASVLSVGLNVGFSSQSAFYDAFREIEGTTPGQYRKLQAAVPAP